MASGVRDEDWAALRDAVPGYPERWEAFRRSPEYKPGDSWYHVQDLALYLDMRLEKGDDAPLLAAIGAFESVYAGAGDELEGLLRVGLLEDVIHFCQDHRYDIAAVFRRLGPAGRGAWAHAWRYTHGGREWPAPAEDLHPRPKPSGRRKR